MSDETTPPVCFLNGEWIPFRDARLPVFDLAIMQGATVTERFRTFQHRPYDVDRHLERLNKSLELVAWPNVPNVLSWTAVIAELCARNTCELTADDDLAVVIFVSAGQSVGDANGLIGRSSPTYCIYTAPLAFSRWRHWYTSGVDLVIPGIRQISPMSIDPRIKMRSRLHWQLADQQVQTQHPGSMALLLDDAGHVTETSSGNLLIVQNGIVRTPLESRTLPGISRDHVQAICHRLGMPFEFCNLTPEAVLAADEACLTSSTYCIAPVRSLNRQQIGPQCPGDVTRQLSQEWANEIGVDFVQQATPR